MRYRDIAQGPTALGCREISRTGGGSHQKWMNPANGRSTTIPDWGGRDLKTGTLHAIVRQLGLDWATFNST